MEVLIKYDWPGNVRELENALERAAVVTRGGEITAAALPERVREAPPVRLGRGDALPNPTMEVVERAYILYVLESESGNKSRAAEILGIDPSTLYRKLNRYGVGD
jgi:two-component system response regulator HydG